MEVEQLKNLYTDFIKSYPAKIQDELWLKQSKKFHHFWYEKILPENSNVPSIDEIDEIIKILDTKAKGNTKDSSAIATVMVPQEAWRKLFIELHNDKKLSEIVTNIFEEEDFNKKVSFIDELYMINKGRGNYLTGKSGNTINALLAAYNPMKNIAMVSMRDRLMLMKHFKFPIPDRFEEASPGYQFVESNRIILENFSRLEINESAITIAAFCYSKQVMALWRDSQTVQSPIKEISVVIPSDSAIKDQDEFNVQEENIRESIKIQAMLAKIGSEMNFNIWLPKSDRARVLKYWSPADGELLESLPLNYNNAVMKTVENIDVLWLKRGSIIRAFEVEHTTSIYSGILRMADLLALLPNINIKLHIVAPLSRKEKVFEEIRRPVFSLLERGAMAEVCSYLSYDSVIEISEMKHLGHFSDSILADFEEFAQL